MASRRPVTPDPKYAQLAAMRADLLGVASAAGAVEYLNPAVERSLGFTVADLVGRPLRGMVHADDLPSLEEAVLAATAVPASVALAFRALHAKGGWT